jgi:hypothetical protein
MGWRFGDVRDDAAFDGDAILHTLADEPGEIDGSVYADGSEGGSGLTARRQF